MKRSSIALGIAVLLAASIGACGGNSSNPVTPALPAFSVLTGKVTEPIEVPLAGAAVTILDGPAKGRSTTTDGAGHYMMAFGTFDGQFNVEIRKEGYASIATGVTLPRPEDLNVQLVPLVAPSDVSGSWNVAFHPDPTCPDAVKKLGVRRYRASIVQRGAQVTVSLSGADFTSQPEMTGLIHGTEWSVGLSGGCSDFYCYYGITDLALVTERLGNDRLLEIEGMLTVHAGGSSMDGFLSGSYTLRTAADLTVEPLAACGSSFPVKFTR